MHTACQHLLKSYKMQGMFSYATVKRFGCFTQDRLNFESYNFRIKKQRGKLNCLQKLFWVKVTLPNSEKVFVNIRSLAKRLKVTPRFAKLLISGRTKNLQQIIATCQKITPFAKSLAEEESLSRTGNLKKSLILWEKIESQKESLSFQAKNKGSATGRIGERHLLAHFNSQTSSVDFFLSLKKPLGKGGYRTVYPLMNCQTFKVFQALSVQLPSKSNQIKKMEREYRFLTTLQNVKEVVKPYFFINNQNGLFLVTKRCESTFDQIIRDPKVSQKKKLQLFREVLKGVAAIHEQGIIHRDIKPQNILLDKKGKIKIIDFNLSCLKTETSKLVSFCGTAIYQPPEGILRQAKTEPEKIDSWGLGIILYMICEGKRPEFTRLFKEQVHLPIQQQEKILQAAKKLEFSRLKKNDPLIPVIRGLLHTDPHKRLSAKEALLHL